MVSNIHYMTAEGLDRLQKELEHLKGPARQNLSARLRAAIQMGDLSENADYIQAKEEQGFLEGRIQELEAIVHNVVIIDDVEKNLEEISIGDHVTVEDLEYNEEETYYLVGPKEADPVKGRISYESPIGRALLKHKVGDVVLAETPGGTIRLKVLKIE
ncbi:MAG TPA: transcription elongation factor GreA [Anaerolineaceae bacterium]|nr:transcription elongation factor GreA [Anaerolineaceae bacterium]